MNGPHKFAGRVEVREKNVWGVVCGRWHDKNGTTNYIGHNEANALCKIIHGYVVTDIIKSDSQKQNFLVVVQRKKISTNNFYLSLH